MWCRAALVLAFAASSGCSRAAVTIDIGPTIAERELAELTSAEIMATGAQSAHDVVQQLAGKWLEDPPDDTSAHVTVFMETDRLGGVEALREIRAADVLSIRYLAPAAAVARFGRAVRGGAIVLSRKHTD